MTEDREKNGTMEDTAAQAMMGVKRVASRRSVNIDEVEFTDDLDMLDLAMEREEKIVEFENPRGGKPMVFLVRPLTPGEFAMVFGTLFGKSAIQVALDSNEEAGEDSEEANADLIEKHIRENYTEEEIEQKWLERQIQTIQIGVIRPKGLTKERIAKWDQFYIDALYNAINGEVMANDSPSQFPEVAGLSE